MDDILRFENIAMRKHFALNYSKEPRFLDYSAKGKAVKNWHSKAMLIDLEDKTVAAVTKQHRKRIKYACSSCKPESGNAPCVVACSRGAIRCM